MHVDNTALQDYSFDRSVFVRFLDRSDFSLAKYHKISLDGFSCFCSKTLKKDEVSQVEVNLKMITQGEIDDLDPHVATARLTGLITVDNKQVCCFKFIHFKENCFENLVKALVFLDSKEKPSPISLSLHKQSKHPGKIDDTVKDIIEKTKKGRFILPVLPKIVQEVEVIVNHPESTIEDLAMVIERDSVITLKMLSTANSLFYRGDSQIYSISETIPRLGFKATHNLVLTIANKSLYQVKNKLFKQLFEKLWKHSLTCAHCSKAIAEAKGLPDPDFFYTAGLLHDIGKTILFRFLSDITFKNNMFNEQEIVSSTERYNSQMSQIILQHWGFPSRFVNSISMNYGHKINDEKTEKASLVIHTANIMARKMGYDLVDNLVDLSAVDGIKLLGIDPVTMYKISENVKTMMEDSDNAF